MAGSSQKFRTNVSDGKLYLLYGLLWSLVVILFSKEIRDSLVLLDWETARASLPSPNDWTVLALACVTAGGVTALVHPSKILAGMWVVGVLVIQLGLEIFQPRILDINWSLYLNGMLGTAVSVFVAKEFRYRIRRTALTTAYGRMFQPDVMRHVLEDPRRLNRSHHQVPLTVMLVEVDGLLSRLTGFEHQTISDRFAVIYDEFVQLIHQLGGKVLPVASGSMVAIFGDELVEGVTIAKHAERALQAGVHLQRRQVDRILTDGKEKRPVMALRIGVATTRCFVAATGSEDAPQFHVMGAAVEEARHLVEHCDVGSILFSRMTRDLLIGFHPEANPFSQKMINPLGSKGGELIEVYCCNPLAEHTELGKQVESIVKNADTYQRKGERFPIEDPTQITMRTNVGPAVMENISQGGLCLRLGVAVAMGSIVQVRVDGGNPLMVERLQNRGIVQINCEVRWSSPVGTEYQHGLSFLNLGEDDVEFLLQCVLETQPSSSGKKKTG